MKRITSIDYTKEFAIILVVIGHIIDSCTLKTYIYSFHMPIFFIVSGILLNYKNIDNYSILNKLKKLIVPYIIFSVIYTIANQVANGISLHNIKWDIINILCLKGVGPLWFLPCLFLSEVLFILLNKLIKNRTLLILVTLCIFILAVLLPDINYFEIVFLKAFIGYSFLSIGYFTFKLFNRKEIPTVIIPILLIIGAICTYLNIPVDLNHMKLGNPVLYLIAATSTSFAFILIAKKIPEYPYIGFWGRNSLLVMSLHLDIILLLNNSIIHDIIKTKSIYHIMVFFITMVSNYLLIKIINKYIPFAAGKFNTVKSKRKSFGVFY